MNDRPRPADRASRDGDVLAGQLDRALRQLTGPRAPATLAPRVLAELARQAALPWYHRPWTDWPEIWRWLSSLLLATTVAGLWRLTEIGWAAAKSTTAYSAVETVPTYFQTGETTVQGLTLAVQALPTGWWLMGVLGFAAIGLSSLGLGTAAWRLLRPNSAGRPLTNAPLFLS